MIDIARSVSRLESVVQCLPDIGVSVLHPGSSPQEQEAQCGAEREGEQSPAQRVTQLSVDVTIVLCGSPVASQDSRHTKLMLVFCF